ncbi:hypothetical protein ISS07_02910 [Candidatus Woesearchaeota archaeon]|nr:hypothetical protein [Candidatus Woesearchaeota archaeon]
MQEENIANDKSHLRCKIIIEVLGKPKEHVEKALAQYVDKIKEDPELIILNADYADVKEVDDLWSTFVEMEMVIKGIKKLIAFCFDYMPSSVQIIKPEQYNLDRSMVENFINDLQGRLHQVDMVVKKQKNENAFLKKNMNSAIRNVIMISLSRGKIDEENLCKITGVQKKELRVFLDELIKDKKIEEKENVFSLVREEVENAQE